MEVCFVVGRNGAGKSQYLIDQAKGNNQDSLYLCNTVHDRSQELKTSKRFSVKNTGSHPNNVMKSVIKKMMREGTHRLHQIEKILLYCGYAPHITVIMRAGKIDSRLDDFSDTSSIKKLTEMIDNYFNGEDEISFNVNFGETSDISSLSKLENLLHQEKPLRHYGMVKAIEISLYKNNGEPVPLLNASSGELSLMTSLIFVLGEISGTNMILIDEPENSLHPRWQREYTSMLCSLIEYHEVKVIIATHSPLIVTGAQLDERVSSSIYHPATGNLEFSSSTNIEELLWGQFEIISPKSRFLSEKLAEKLEELSVHKVSLNQAIEFIDSASKASFDDGQQDIFIAARQLADSIARG